MPATKPIDIDEYISGFPQDVQNKLQEVRMAVKKAAPGAAETIKYSMPTYTMGHNLVYFAAYKNHIGFYPAPTGEESFRKDLHSYKQGKGSVQFPLDQPMPIALIIKIVKWRLKKVLEKAKPKKK